MAQADLLSVCRCGVATDLSGRAVVWDSVCKAWRLLIWECGPAGKPVNSLKPVAGCPCCLDRCNFQDTLPAANIPMVVQESLRKLNADNELVAAGGPMAGANLPEPEEC